ncbi:hypothetical protein [Flavobacterium sp.]|jgi:hypothetical protein|uniref:hypothetical protein n=1 Tax=Flavobacterium sp. TaxID=239 RepID=UPI0037C08BC2
MKQTFLYKTFDWILVVVSLYFSIFSFENLINGYEYFSTFLLKIVFFIISITALISLLFKHLNGERFSRIFLIVVLIIPAILVLNQYLVDLIFYSINRLNLIQNYILFLKLIAGLVLLYLAIKFSKQQKAEQIKDIGILIIGISFFTNFYVLVRTIEPNFNSELSNYPIYKTIIKLIIGILTLIIGIRIKNQKVKFNRALIITLILLFTFGLI